ncbi:uncharacterized protein SPSK_07988 [Sporothrix schenckii 1099-18]|uniref:Uncharacterized protein n=1 Tax=Sporothrix schenckii 1099-18 TaxID=1397361 RepID=A0A0F2MJ94_SPOSC|nr:uncharacterized protein SPSK_07988 [Sporothrix schenckii 1099-18]KJR88246.1 hypothetical protein SPSK_07988 [Sporothrix schenckii 1099-18]
MVFPRLAPYSYSDEFWVHSKYKAPAFESFFHVQSPSKREDDFDSPVLVASHVAALILDFGRDTHNDTLLSWHAAVRDRSKERATSPLHMYVQAVLPAAPPPPPPPPHPESPLKRTLPTGPAARRRRTAQQPVYQATIEYDNGVSRMHGVMFVVDVPSIQIGNYKLQDEGQRAVSNDDRPRQKRKKRLISAAQQASK